MNLTALNLTALNVFYALIGVLLASGLAWAVSPYKSPAHNLAVPVFISAAAGAIVVVALRAIAMWT
jgi:hypothetical protein